MFRLAAIAAILAAPVLAQDTDDGAEPLSGGVESLLRDLFDGVEPALRSLRDRIEQFDQYHPPEMLPNGDIIIRRKTPSEAAPLPEDGVEI